MGIPILIALFLGTATVATGVTFTRRRRLRSRRLYQECLERALADGILTDEEAQELAAVREQRDLSEAEVRMVALSLYRRALRDAVADSRITREENEDLQRMRAQLGLSDRDLRADARQLQRIRVLAEVEREHLPRVHAPVALASGEQSHWVVQARLADRLALPGRRSELRAISFNVATAANFSAEGERSELRTSAEILPVDVGILVVTSRRTLFHGARRTLIVPHLKLQLLDLYRDGLALSEADPAQHTFFIVDDPELTSAVLLCAARIRRGELSGPSTRTA